MYKISKKQMKALDGSIEKWDQIRNRQDIDKGQNNCPLCRLYNRGKSCKQCVIYLETGKRFCDGTPYQEWITHHKLCHPENKVQKANKCTECNRLANAEYEFLKELKTRCVVTWWKSYISPIIREIYNIQCR